MRTQRRWLWIGGAIAATAAALALGVSLSTLLIVAAVLACPATMYFGMRGMHQGSGGMTCHLGAADHQPEAKASAASSSLVEPAQSHEQARPG
ncbi:MAG TPA: hypothetical protein VGA58_00430 [bacterium]